MSKWRRSNKSGGFVCLFVFLECASRSVHLYLCVGAVAVSTSPSGDAGQHWGEGWGGECYDGHALFKTQTNQGTRGRGVNASEGYFTESHFQETFIFPAVKCSLKGAFTKGQVHDLRCSWFNSVQVCLLQPLFTANSADFISSLDPQHYL